MIQCIQTLYLLLAAALLAVTVFTPIALFAADGAEMTLSAFEFADAAHECVQSTLWLGIVLSASALLPLIIIFLYKHRQLQIRLCGAELVLLLGDIAFIVIYYMLSARTIENFELSAASLRLGAVMPLVAIVLVAMAMRAIFRDELLVRSLDRIR